YWENMYVRGAVSGLGVVNLYISFLEIFRLRRFARRLVATLLTLVVALLLYGTLSPFHFDFSRPIHDPFHHLLHAWPAHFDRFLLRDAALNFTIFVPLGI